MLFCVARGKIRSSSRKPVICETPLLKQVYDELNEAGKAGLTIAQLSVQLGLHCLDGRMLLRNLCRKGLAVCTLHDKGKSSIHRCASCALLVIGFIAITVISISFVSSSPSYTFISDHTRFHGSYHAGKITATQ